MQEISRWTKAEYAKFFGHVYVIEIIVTLLFAWTLFKGISFTYKLKQFSL